MKHVTPISSCRPATAQLGGFLNILSVITALLTLLVEISTIFGIDLNKNDDEVPEA